MKRSEKRVEGGEGWRLIRSCPKCGRPEPDCRCGQKDPDRDDRGIVIRIRLEKRRGKTVTVLLGTGLEPETLTDLLKALKATCATGGTRKGDQLELQGDHREAARALLEKRGLRVKG